MKISTDAAGEYARDVMNAADVVIGSYFKKISQPTLVEAAIRGMYKARRAGAVGHQGQARQDQEHAKSRFAGRPHRGPRAPRQTRGPRQGQGRHLFVDGDDGQARPAHRLHRSGDLERFKTQPTGKLSGIGVQIRRNDSARDMLQVVTPIKDSPAYKAKIQAGDIITTIIREVDSEGNAAAQARSHLHQGHDHRATPSRRSSARPAPRSSSSSNAKGVKQAARVQPDSRLSRGRNRPRLQAQANDDWNYVIDPENKICYVRLTQFSENTVRDLESVMKKLSKAGIKGFILDLRFNPGGLLDSAVKISDLFIDDGLIVTIRPRDGPETSYVGRGGRQLHRLPDGVPGQRRQRQRQRDRLGLPAGPRPGHHHRRAQLRQGQRANDRSRFPTTGGIIKLTTATFWRPSGKNLNKSSTSGKDDDEWGVTPNKGYDLPLSVKESTDLQDYQERQGNNSQTRHAAGRG